jgi:hypothetical protein
MTAPADQPPPVETLETLLHAGGQPLFAAFSARLRALDLSSDGSDGQPVDDGECAALLDTLRQSVIRSPNVEEIVALAAAVSRVRMQTAEPRCRRAMQSLDWALRDLFLERYTLVHRKQYVAATGLFLDLLRRRASTHATLHAVLPSATPVDADRRLNSPRAIDTLHS